MVDAQITLRSARELQAEMAKSRLTGIELGNVLGLLRSITCPIPLGSKSRALFARFLSLTIGCLAPLREPSALRPAAWPPRVERVARKTNRTRDQARADVFDYIERFYNPRRRHSTIGYISPMELEQRVL